MINLAKEQFNDLWQELMTATKKTLSNEDLIAPAEAPRLHKYDSFIPNNLLRKAYSQDCLDVEGMQQVMASWEGKI